MLGRDCPKTIDLSEPTGRDIATAAVTNVLVVREHRRDIKKGRALASMLADQLNSAMVYRDDLQSEIDAETADDPARRISLSRAISLPAHAAILRDLSAAMKNFIPLERQAFGLDSNNEGSTQIVIKPAAIDKPVSAGTYQGPGGAGDVVIDITPKKQDDDTDDYTPQRNDDGGY
jgi:hypothetical protein